MTLFRVFGDLGGGSVPGETLAGTTVFLWAAIRGFDVAFSSQTRIGQKQKYCTTHDS